MSENDDIVPDSKEQELVCEECHKLFDTDNGELVTGWEAVYFVSTSDQLCFLCKDEIIHCLCQMALG